MVQRRLTVFVDGDENLAEAIVSASSDSMSIRPEEMQIEWDVEEFDLVEDDEEEGDEEFEDDELDDVDIVESSDVVVISEESETPVAPEVTEEIGLENLDLDMAPEPDGDPYDVYALALHKHVIRRNLRTVSEFSGRFAGVQPKILTLAAAVNSRAAVVIDIEPNTMITSVVSNGLPEVIREVGLDQNMSHVQWVNLVRTQISRAVSFYDSLFPEDTLGLDVDVFVTGEFERPNRAIDEALESLPYVRAELPQTLRAPEEFSFEKYAANVGLVIVSGKRFWQRAPVHLLQTPKFDYRPNQYRPRPIPVRAAMNIAAALILGFGVFTAFGLFTEQTESTAATQRSLGILEQRVELRTLRLEQTRAARATLNESKMKTERLIAANEVIQDRDAGFADTVSIIEGVAPSDVTITTIDDDGRVVAVEAESDDYSTLLAYIRVLEDIPQFVHVQVLTLGKTSGDELGNELAAGSSGSAQAETVIEMSIEITRIEIDDREILSNEELAVVKPN
jgi:Tfp pilus assembly protein PilN